jgi:hypothetical protein
MNTKENNPVKKKIISPENLANENEEENENLGLDADHSSDTPYHYLNNDNDIISENPDGETDRKDNSGPLGQSPLMEK